MSSTRPRLEEYQRSIVMDDYLALVLGLLAYLSSILPVDRLLQPDWYLEIEYRTMEDCGRCARSISPEMRRDPAIMPMMYTIGDLPYGRIVPFTYCCSPW